MNTSTRVWLGVATIGLVLAGCERSATGPSQGASTAAAPPLSAVSARDGRSFSERTVSETLYDLTDSYFSFACDEQGEAVDPEEGELVRLEGSVYERVTLLRDAAGGSHATWHTMPVGLRGTGVTSGEEFRVTEREQRAANQTLHGLTGAYRYEVKLVGKDTRRTFWIVWTGHYSITADDEVIVQRDREHVRCRA